MLTLLEEPRSFKAGDIVKYFKAEYNDVDDTHRLMYYYKIIAIATTPLHGGRFVVYQELFDEHNVIVNTYGAFVNGMVDKNKYPECKQVYKYEIVL